MSPVRCGPRRAQSYRLRSLGEERTGVAAVSRLNVPAWPRMIASTARYRAADVAAKAVDDRRPVAATGTGVSSPAKALNRHSVSGNDQQDADERPWEVASN